MAMPSLTLSAAADPSRIREETLRDPRYPVHKIADRLLPYLAVLVERFQPQRVILFGSYAYGEPTRHSDVDLLILKELHQSPVKEAVAIRQAWWKMPRSEPLLSFDLLVISPERHRERMAHAAGFYDRIVEDGLRLV